MLLLIANEVSNDRQLLEDRIVFVWNEPLFLCSCADVVVIVGGGGGGD